MGKFEAGGFRCRVCHAEVARERLPVREMMFGSGEVFDYLVCDGCGTLQIETIPSDLAHHYPADYYSFATPPASPRERFLRRWGAALALNPLLRPFGRLPFARRAVARLPEWLGRVPGLRRSHAVLDVGCGGGALLDRLADAGFTNLTGADPHISAPGNTGRFRLMKAELADIEPAYDLVMMHHALEHVADPLDALRHLRRLTRPGGRVVVSLPLAQGLPWREYRAKWVHLDAPRHLHLFTADSFAAAALRAGLRLERTIFDTAGYSLLGSELFRRGLPIMPRDGSKAEDVFTPAERSAFAERAAALNRSGDADAATFVLAPVSGVP